MKVWITKYALTDGIWIGENADNCLTTQPNGTMIQCTNVLTPKGKKTLLFGCFHGRDWHKSEGAAIVRAEGMRLKKIETLQHQLMKLETMKIKWPV